MNALPPALLPARHSGTAGERVDAVKGAKRPVRGLQAVCGPTLDGGEHSSRIPTRRAGAITRSKRTEHPIPAAPFVLIPGDTTIGCFTNMGPSAPGWVHKAGQHTRMACPPATCNDTNTTGNAFLQAFWESSHDRSCFNSPCYDMQGSAGLEETIRAFYYAIFTLPPAPTHVQLSANFLTYYCNFVGQNEWNDRWWLFNHHALVGPKSGYSACHM